MEPRDRLILALDVPTIADAEAMVTRLGDSVSFYKIGYQLAFAGGLSLARELIQDRKKVFIDLKLHDIGNTVAKGVESVAKLGATFLTVHAYPQTMHAAVDARKGTGLRILAVTVLTSYDDADLAAAGYDFTVKELVAERAAQAVGRTFFLLDVFLGLLQGLGVDIDALSIKAKQFARCRGALFVVCLSSHYSAPPAESNSLATLIS